jgi:chaperonin GroEL (HSP60 family)
MSIFYSQVGPSVLSAGAQDYKGSDAKMSIIVGAMAVSDLVKSTLGPKGMVFLINFSISLISSCSLF